MSSPIDRSPDTGEVSRYAPKWARDVENVLRQHTARQPRRMAGGSDMVTVVSADSPGSEYYPSLAPTILPEPPMPEPWPGDNARIALRGGGGMAVFFPLLFAMFLAALIALVFVVEWPNIWSFVAKQRTTAGLFWARFDGEPPRAPATPRTTASEPRPTTAAHSDNASPAADPWITAENPAAIASFAPLPPAAPTPAAAATTAQADAAPVTSPPATPRPAAVVASAADVAPSAESVPVKSVKTVPIERENPARPLGTDEIETLLKQGEDFVSVGDFVSARLVYRRVAEAHDARGALAVAATYDPTVLAKIGAKGVTGDAAKAHEWYARARDLGSSDAAARLEALANSTR
jgi:hypothetical protein